MNSRRDTSAPATTVLSKTPVPLVDLRRLLSEHANPAAAMLSTANDRA
jgi:hypothetical protein